MIKERKIESIRFETKAVIYQNETGFKILAGVAYNADSGEMLRKCTDITVLVRMKQYLQEMISVIICQTMVVIYMVIKNSA